jgi:hypothetical protein
VRCYLYILEQSSKCRSGDFVAVYYQLHHGISALRIENDHFVIHFLNYGIDEGVVIFYSTPPKAKDLLLCERALSNAFEDGSQIFSS